MPSMVPLLFLIGGATVAAVASGKKKTKKKPPPPEPSGPPKTYSLDANMPAQLRDQVLAALAQETDPAQLEAFATAIAAQYPLSAAALRMKAAALRGGAMPQNPLDLLSTVPDPPRSQVVQQLMAQTDPNALEAYAVQLQAQYPAAAAALRMKEAILRGQVPMVSPPTPAPAPNPPPLPSPPPIVPAVPPVQPVVQPVPVPVPVPSLTPIGPAPMPSPPPAPSVPPMPTPGLPSLDPEMPPEMQRAVLGALTTENDPAKLEGFASAIQSQYPIASGLLMAKAQALRLAQQPPSPAPVPAIPPIPSLPPMPLPPAPPQPSPMPAPYPVGDASTRTGRNAGRPTGYPFIHLHGESTWPAKIAEQATGSEANYPQMSRLNPQFSKDGLHWVNIRSGDALNIPWEWAPKLAGLYRIEVDPGVVGPAQAAAPIAAAHAPLSIAMHAPVLPPAGSHHVAHS